MFSILSLKSGIVAEDMFVEPWTGIVKVQSHLKTSNNFIFRIGSIETANNGAENLDCPFQENKA